MHRRWKFKVGYTEIQDHGSLMYMMTTRPYIAFVASLILGFKSGPYKIYVKSLKRILRCVNSTCSYGIRYPSTKDVTLVGYCDSNCARLSNDRQLILALGEVFLFDSSVEVQRNNRL